MGVCVCVGWWIIRIVSSLVVSLLVAGDVELVKCDKC